MNIHVNMCVILWLYMYNYNDASVPVDGILSLPVIGSNS